MTAQQEPPTSAVDALARIIDPDAWSDGPMHFARGLSKRGAERLLSPEHAPAVIAALVEAGYLTKDQTSARWISDEPRQERHYYVTQWKDVP